MCWNPCVKISDVEVTALSDVGVIKKPGPNGDFEPTEGEIRKAIVKSIPESGCEKECPCSVDPDEPKKPHQRKDKAFKVTIKKEGKGSAIVDGKCNIKYNTQAGICEPEVFLGVE